LNKDNLLASPTSPGVEVSDLVGKKVQYVKNDKVWTGMVESAEDPFIVIKFDEFPTGIGQGQIIEVLEGPEDELQAQAPNSRN